MRNLLGLADVSQTDKILFVFRFTLVMFLKPHTVRPSIAVVVVGLTVGGSLVFLIFNKYVWGSMKII